MALTQIVNDGLGASLTATSEGGAVTTSIQQGVAKQWCNLNGTGTIAIRDSFSTTSIADNATGDYSINYSSAMNNDDYSHTATVGLAGQDNTTATGWSGQTTTQTQVHTRNCYSNYAIDGTLVSSTIHGDLA